MTAPSACSASLPASMLKTWPPISASCLIATDSSSVLVRHPTLYPLARSIPRAQASGRADVVWGDSRLMYETQVPEGAWVDRERCLAAQPEAADDGAVPVHVIADEVREQPSALPDELEQPAARVIVLREAAQMLRQRLDPLGEKRNLHLG